MERVLLARHAESELSVLGLLNGDPRVPCGLTALGKAQAKELGRSLASEPIEIAITSDFERCRLTALIALAERDVQLLELEALRDIHDGDFDGGPIEDCLEWAHGAPAIERPPGRGESRVDVARRLAAGLREVLRRPESTALVVSHQLPVAYMLRAARGRNPKAQIEPIPYAYAFALEPKQLELTVDTLEAWASRPDW